ncbi:MAG: bile acid:sodium symporter family protein [Acidobacteriota bacterium]
MTGGLVAAAFLVLALVAGRSRRFHAFAFALWVLAFVSTALAYPQLFREWGGRPTSGLVPILIQIIMFGMGTTLGLNDFARVGRTPWPALVGIGLQFLIMPSLAALLAWAFGFTGALAAGIILIGAAPGGVASNVITYLSGGNVALSVSLTAVSTVLSPFLTPLAMTVLAGTYIQIDAAAMMWSIMQLIILPIVAGFVVNHLLRSYAHWRDRLLPIVSMGAICLVLAIMTAAARDRLLAAALSLLVLVILHNTGGYLLGYWGSRAAGLKEAEARTVCIEVGMQNAGMAAGLAVSVLHSPEAGLAATAFGTVMNVSGALLASYWRGRPAR